jgi:hypothetical protein
VQPPQGRRKLVGIIGRCDHAPAISLNDYIFTGVTASVAEQLTRAALRGELLQDLHHGSPSVVCKSDPYAGPGAAGEKYSVTRTLVQTLNWDGVIPLETIYDEIGNVRNLLLEEADRAMEGLCGSIGCGKATQEEIQRAGGFTAMRPMAAPTKGGAAVAPAAEILLLSEEKSSPLRHFYFNEVRPFLERPAERRLLVSDAGRSQLGFSGLRTLLPEGAHATVDDLEDVCEEARQLKKQQRLYRWLHLWLLVHIPISLALIVLGAVHSVMALKY